MIDHQTTLFKTIRNNNCKFTNSSHLIHFKDFTTAREMKCLLAAYNKKTLPVGYESLRIKLGIFSQTSSYFYFVINKRSLLQIECKKKYKFHFCFEKFLFSRTIFNKRCNIFTVRRLFCNCRICHHALSSVLLPPPLKLFVLERLSLPNNVTPPPQ